jgi:hypothetical protein
VQHSASADSLTRPEDCKHAHAPTQTHTLRRARSLLRSWFLMLGIFFFFCGFLPAPSFIGRLPPCCGVWAIASPGPSWSTRGLHRAAPRRRWRMEEGNRSRRRTPRHPSPPKCALLSQACLWREVPRAASRQATQHRHARASRRLFRTQAAPLMRVRARHEPCAHVAFTAYGTSCRRAAQPLPCTAAPAVTPRRVVPRKQKKQH